MDAQAIELTLEQQFNRAIATELLQKRKPDITDAEIDRLFTLCKGNPWDVAVVYDLLEIANQYDIKTLP